MTAVRALLLAAGEARRYGAPKLLAPFRGEPLVRRAARSALEAVGSLIVVTGAKAEAVTQALEGLPVAIVHNVDWAQGMGASIACGMRQLTRTGPVFDAVLICLADQPLLDAPALRALVAAQQAAPRGIAAAAYAGTVGAPCVFPQIDFPALSALTGAAGAKRLLEASRARVRAVPMPDAAVDIDTVEDYRSLLARQEG